MMVVDSSMLTHVAALQERPEKGDTVAMLDVFDVRSGN